MNTIENNLKEGETLFADGRIDEAEEFFLSVIENDKNNKNAYNNLGVVAIQKEDVMSAIEYFTKSLEIDPFYKDAIFNYANLLKTLNQLHIAVPLLEKIAEINPDDEEIRRLLKDVSGPQRDFVNKAEAANSDKVIHTSPCKENQTKDKDVLSGEEILHAPSEIAENMSRITKLKKVGNDESIFLKHVPPELIKYKRGMNICVYADFNIAGNLTMLMHLINKYTIHKARCIIVFDDYISYDRDVVLKSSPADKNVDPVTVTEAEQIVSQADFFHIGRQPLNFGKVDFNKTLNKNNCVIQYFGTEYRDNGSQFYKMHMQTGIRGISWWDWTMLNHGLLFYHIDHMLDLETIRPPISRPMDVVKICHSPTNRAFKNTDLFLQVMQRIQKKHKNVELILLEGLSNSECLRRKQEAHILFDQISVGMYALSAIESLAMEQVVLCSLSNFGMSFCPDSPVVPVHRENLYEVLDDLVTHPEKIVRLGKRGREYVRRKHSPEKAIVQYTYLWDLIVNGLRLVDQHQDLFIKDSFANKELLGS